MRAGRARGRSADPVLRGCRGRRASRSRLRRRSRLLAGGGKEPVFLGDRAHRRRASSRLARRASRAARVTLLKAMLSSVSPFSRRSVCRVMITRCPPPVAQAGPRTALSSARPCRSGSFAQPISPMRVVDSSRVGDEARARRRRSRDVPAKSRLTLLSRGRRNEAPRRRGVRWSAIPRAAWPTKLVAVLGRCRDHDRDRVRRAPRQRRQSVTGAPASASKEASRPRAGS